MAKTQSVLDSLKAMDESEIADLRQYVSKLAPTAETKAVLDGCKAELAARRAAKSAERGKAIAAKFSL